MTDTARVTVTLLFTDIVGSTRRWEQEPALMSTALLRHDDILRRAIENAGGRVFKTVGDAFCAAFPTASTAVVAAAAIQRSLADEEWSTSAPLTVRMGIHSGVCESREGDFFGPTVNRTARLQSLAHGGQIIVSRTVAELLHDDPVSGLGLRDLGAHALKDLERPEHVFQVTGEGLLTDFPDLRSVPRDLVQHNLPSHLSSFVGRREELDELQRMTASHRLVTLTGSGGCGKSRLAIELAREMVALYDDGAWLIEFAPLNDSALVVTAVVAGLPFVDRSITSLDALCEALRGRRVLLVFDNCEHLLDEVARVTSALLEASPTSLIVATSREPLALGGESVFRVPSLEIPRSGESLEVAAASASVQLFLDRARLHTPTMACDEIAGPPLVSIVTQLEGIPLALELAAARLRVMSLEELNQRLGDHLRVLTGGNRSISPRQQTLRAMIDWSYNLLSDDLQRSFCALSVFAGHFSLDAAEAVLGDDALDALGSLMDKSLIQAIVSAGVSRYSLLESLRQYGREKLELDHDAAMAARGRHAEYFAAFVRSAYPHLGGADQDQWHQRLEADQENIFVALRHFADTPSTKETALAMSVALRTFWLYRFRSEEGIALVSPLLASTSEKPTALEVRACAVLGRCYLLSRDVDAASQMVRQGREMLSAVTDGAATADLATLEALIYFRRGEAQAAVVAADAAIASAPHEETDLRAIAYRIAGSMRAELGGEHVEEGRAHLSESLALFRALNDRRNTARVLEDLGLLEVQVGHLVEARRCFEEALAIVQDYESGMSQLRRLANVTLNLATVALLDGDLVVARGQLLRSFDFDHTWDDLVVYQLLQGALVSDAADRTTEAAYFHGAATAIIDRDKLVLERVEAELRERSLAHVHERVGDEHFATHMARGAASSLEDALTDLRAELLH